VRTVPIFAKCLIHDKDKGRPRELSKIWDIKYFGANMTNETMKALLMILIIGSVQAAIHIPKIWASQQWAFLVRAMAHVRSAIVLTDRALQSAFIKRKSRKPLLVH
jgi:hypothetical protein